MPFKTKHTPWNKGLHIYLGGKRFIKGQVPWNKPEEQSKVCLVCKNNFIKPAGIGKKRWEERKFCSIKCADVGRNYTLNTDHPSWKGGTTSLQHIIRTSNKYLRWREDVYKRDNWRCVLDGLRRGWNKELKKRILLNADHIKPFAQILKEYKITNLQDAKRISILWDINNGRTLCVDCHRGTDTFGINQRYKEGVAI